MQSKPRVNEVIEADLSQDIEADLSQDRASVEVNVVSCAQLLSNSRRKRTKTHEDKTDKDKYRLYRNINIKHCDYSER